MSERDMKKLLQLIAQRVGLGYGDVVSWLREQNSMEAIEQRILRGDYGGAVANVDAAALKIASEIHEGYVTSGQTTAEWLDAKVADKLVRFDAADPSVVARARANQLELVTGFRDEQYKISQQITQQAIIESATLGTNPRRIAMDFRDSIGLTSQQSDWVTNYRRALEQGDYVRATGYELSSGQADRTLRSYADRGKTLTPAQIDDFTERYRQNAITLRATTIARTEALANAHAGVDDAIQQAIRRGDLEADQLEKEWHSRGASPRARPDHQAMDGVRIPVGRDFELPDGTLMSRPGDRRGGAKHNANCGCSSSTAFVS